MPEGRTVIWFLNNFLTSWRNAVNRKFVKRSKTSDGTIGDLRHQAESFSEHNPDRDGSVDAWDMDVNLQGSSNQTGSAAELKEVELLIKAFQRLPESQLWIHNRVIANRDIGNWQRRPYHGVNPHDHHVHWQSRSSMEKVAVKANVLEDIVVDAINNPIRLVSHSTSTIPAWPTSPDKSFGAHAHNAPYYKTVERAQRRLHERGWKIAIDGKFGPGTERIIKAFQKEKGLKADGRLGPKTWAALWAAPITGGK